MSGEGLTTQLRALPIYSNMAHKWGRKTKYSVLSSGDFLCGVWAQEKKIGQENYGKVLLQLWHHKSNTGLLKKKRTEGVHNKMIFYGF